MNLTGNILIILALIPIIKVNYYGIERIEGGICIYGKSNNCNCRSTKRREIHTI